MNRSYHILRVMVGCLVIASLFSGVTAQESTALPLSEPGPFVIGTHELTLTDAAREDRPVKIAVWYPALEAREDAAPLLDPAPYPVIVYSHGAGGNPYENGIAEHLASYGFVVIGVDHRDDTSGVWVDRPMDILLALAELTRLNEESDLAGVADLERLGAAGWSMGAITTLQLAGVRLDRANHAAWCVDHPRVALCPPQSIIDTGWAYMTKLGQFDENDLWYLPSDWQLDAIAVINPGFSPAFGAKGLAVATVPTLMLSGYLDQDCPYQDDQVYIFEHLGADDLNMITMIAAGHNLPASPIDTALQTKHFLVAYFGYRLQGQTDYADYLTEDYVNQIDGLHWGIYSE